MGIIFFWDTLYRQTKCQITFHRQYESDKLVPKLNIGFLKYRWQFAKIQMRACFILLYNMWSPIIFKKKLTWEQTSENSAVLHLRKTIWTNSEFGSYVGGWMEPSKLAVASTVMEYLNDCDKEISE